MNPAPRIVFFGYSEVGYDCLKLLLNRGCNVVALFTHEDHPSENIWFKTPAQLAKEHQIPVLTPESLRGDAGAQLVADFSPDLILSVYYRHMIPQRVLDLAPLGAFNIHGSLLPKFRGRAPINWAVLHGETHIGMTLHRMVKAPDAGEIIDQQAVEISPRATAEEAFRAVQPCATIVLDRQLHALLAGISHGTPQDNSQATYFGGRKPEDGRINWSLPATQIFNLIRAVTKPYPGAFIDFSNARLMIWWAEVEPKLHGKPGEILSLSPLTIATSNGALRITDSEWLSQPTSPLTNNTIL